MRDSKTRTVPRGVLFAVPAGLAAFSLYAATAARSIHTGDSPELSAAVSCFGVPHPPGYPLYTALTALWVHLFPVAQRAFASNLASSLYGAVAVGLLFHLLRRLGLGTIAAGFGAASLALGRSFWSQSLAAEVYTFDAMLLVLGLHAVLSAARGTAGGGASRTSRRFQFLAGLVLGLWIGHRFLNLIYLPAVVAFYRQVPRLDPDRWDREMQEAYLTIGRTIPALQLGGRARQAIQSLELGGR